VSLTPDEAMKQAKMTAHDYMLSGVFTVRELMGKRYEYDYPNEFAILVAAHMKTAAIDFQAWQLSVLSDTFKKINVKIK